jgi:UDP-2,4-diacetamido-2,4,6-trideoxy-beta-L-altropyranose hydrolase
MDSGLMSDLIVRADATSRSGTGHLMRTLALAQRWQAEGGTATFISYCESEALRSQIVAAGFKFVELEREHPEPSDLRLTLAALAENSSGQAGAGAPFLVLDGYHFDADYQRAVREAGQKLLVIDDTAHLGAYHADILLNQNITATDLDYHADADTLMLRGTEYALLRPDFLGWRERGRAAPALARKILVTLGGSDPDNITARVIEALRLLEPEGLEVRILVGAANPHYDELGEMVERAGQALELLRATASEMPGLMAWAEMAVAAAGSTCWELAFMGLPSVLIVLAENQRDIARKMAACGAAISAGEGVALDAERLARMLTALSLDHAGREELSRRGRQLVDGLGAERVVKHLKERAMIGSEEKHERPGLSVRPATLDDARLLWEWANDRSVRDNSIRKESIPWESHLSWYGGRLSSGRTRFWILEAAGEPVGQIRYDKDEGGASAEISFSVAGNQRGRGYGTELIRRTLHLATRELDVARITAITFVENRASYMAFIRTGFKSTGVKQVGGQECYELCWEPEDTGRLGAV